MLCPFCKEDIHPEAIKCKHCRSTLSPANNSEDVSNIADIPSFETSFDGTSYQLNIDVNIWLNNIGMGEYMPIFKTNNITLSNLPEISENDLINMGIISIGHRKVILSNIVEYKSSHIQKISSNQFRYIKWFYGALAIISAFLIFILGKDSMMNVIMWWIIVQVVIAIYFLPTTIAFKKGNDYRWGIFIVNAFFGISFVGWIIALVVSMGLLSAQAASVLAYFAPNKGLRS